MFNSLWLGTQDYAECFSLQMKYWQGVKAKSTSEIILGVEHPSIITLGVRGNLNEDLIMDAKIPFVKTDRGGQATLHSPGQLVIYPIISLREHKWGVREFIEKLLLTTQSTFQHWNIRTQLELECGTGLYTEKGKIAFCGLRIKEGISYHGISINLTNDLGLFQQIRPCGISAAKMDRGQDWLDHSQDNIQQWPAEFFKKWCEEFFKN